jgi:hypothetical protein
MGSSLERGWGRLFPGPMKAKRIKTRKKKKILFLIFLKPILYFPSGIFKNFVNEP